MAGAWSPGCCQGSSSSSCVCDRRGKWSESSLLGRRLSEDSRRHQLLQKWTSMWSSSGGDGSGAEAPAGAEEAPRAAGAAAEAAAGTEAEAAEPPLVFLCSQCRRPLGDSLSWVTCQEDTNCILLRCVSCNVAVDKEQKLSKRKDEDGCILETLYCAGCSLNLGYIYRCTPKNLDYKRDLFCLSVEAIESYALGSSEKQMVPEDKELFNLESRVEVEKSLKQMEDVLVALQRKLWEVESKLAIISSNR
ncbi:protein Mis18-alpha [Perognathus longimembris pacificus]|uniref:protein Mis18-alpha n=1 Tax=Perognathus longimembris pacificus TaxID=214514 RepID=UPI002019D3AA|nr:protein Mis18-alpha [Perognathus longimembris pacificus]